MALEILKWTFYGNSSMLLKQLQSNEFSGRCLVLIYIYWHRYEWHTHFNLLTMFNLHKFTRILSLSPSQTPVNPIVHASTYYFQILLNIQSFYNWLLKSDLRTWTLYLLCIHDYCFFVNFLSLFLFLYIFFSLQSDRTL